MIYKKQVEEIVRAYSAKLALKPKKEWNAEELAKLMQQFANDVAVVVRDATLRFYEAKAKNEPPPPEIAALPIFINLPPYIPPAPTGMPPSPRAVIGSP
jgi:hypothetical protein